MRELDEHAAAAEREELPDGPRPDSLRRSESRRARRQQAIEQAAAFGRDPYMYAVDRVEKVAPDDPHDTRVRPVVRRRLRHPRAETLERVRDLRTQGLVLSAIADELRISENYTRRLIHEIEGEEASKVPRKANSHAASKCLSCPPGVAVPPGVKSGG
jgi:hypothetical protein